jgi:F420-dependent oxidoreductase-like protein
MIEGQDGVNWPIWKEVVRLVEDAGYFGLYRSDHFTNPMPPEKDSLELWISLAWLADHTRRITFGPLVTPFSFREPAMTARMARDVDDLSGGRLVLGLGAGWEEREHTLFGLPLLDMDPRFDRFEEGVDVVHRLLHSDLPVDFFGQYYNLRQAILLPRPQRPAGPPILIGGNGERRTLPLVARFASEWNAVFVAPQRFAELNARLDGLLSQHNRAPAEVTRSLMTGLVFGRNESELRDKLRGRSPAELESRGVIVGTPAAVRDAVSHLEAVGVQRIMLQWLDLEDLAGIEALAAALL